MWIDEVFGDLKKHGFDRLSTAQEERAILRLPDRLSRLTLDIALWHEWFISMGTKVIQNSVRHLINRNEQRDLCIFQIGLRYIERRLTNSLPSSAVFCSYRWHRKLSR